MKSTKRPAQDQSNIRRKIINIDDLATEDTTFAGNNSL